MSTSARARSGATRPAARDVRHLGDYTITPRALLVMALAVPVGIVAAGAAWVLVKLIGLVTNLVFFGSLGTALVSPGSQPHPAWLTLLAPVTGGLLVGLMARYGSERIRGHGMPETIEAINLNGSKVQPRVAALKPLSAAISIGTGGPFGAEGPIIVTGGALGSLTAQFLRMTADERKTLLVAGAVAGMAATFNAPLAGVLLAVELLLFEYRPRSLLPVAVAVVVATAARGPLLGTASLFPQPGTSADDLGVLVFVLALVLGVVTGAVASVASHLVYFSEDAFRRLPIHWMWWPAIGGLIIGLGGLVEPRALGVGYDVIGAELAGTIGLGAAVSILAVKVLIWSLSLGSGTSGGVLAPMFLVGGAVGAIASYAFPAVSPGFWAAVALGGMVAALLGAPLTAVAFAIELTGNLGLLLPLVAAAAGAYAFSTLTMRRSILTEKIARHGFHLSREYDVDPLEVVFVSEVVENDVVSLRADVTAGEAHAAIGSGLVDDEASRQRLYPVVAPDGTYVGVLRRHTLLAAAARHEAAIDPDTGTELAYAGTPVATIAVTPRAVTHVDQTLRVVAEMMAEHEVSRVPVTTQDDPTRIVGVVSLSELLAGRRRDQREARERERVLRPRFVVPAWAAARPLRQQGRVETAATGRPGGPRGPEGPRGRDDSRDDEGPTQTTP